MKNLHENSTASFKEQKENGRAENFRKQIYDLLFRRSIEDGLSDREIMSILNETDVNNIRPEITRLIDDGLVQEVGKKKCQWTNKTVRFSIGTGRVYFPRHQKPKGDLFLR